MRLYQQLKNAYHFVQSHGWRHWYGRPDRHLRLYGITGTNGKTTTCYVLAGILAAARGEARVGMLTTVALRVGTREERNETKLTTLPSRTVWAYLARMHRAGVTDVVLEMTSHALDQHRLAGVRLAGAAILNISREHLDYHRTMAAYAAAKATIVRYLAPGALLVGKADDPAVAAILAAAAARGVPTASFTAAAAATVATPLPGAVNQENVLAATLLARAVGIPEPAINRGIAAVTAVPGRMEWVTVRAGVRVLIDYAVTPDALVRLYDGARREAGRGRVIGVLGAAGLRDRGKRPDMARVVAERADELVLTREDPWTESEDQIFSDLEAGLAGTDTPWQKIVDRRDAIAYCLRAAQPGDVIVLTGKGAETGMAIGKKIIPWNDRQVVLELGRDHGAAAH